jgi:hypothetical protein
MPNWCENDLRVEGPRADLERLLEEAKGESPFDFNRFIPYPEEFRRLDEVRDAWEREHGGHPGVDWASRPADGFNAGGCEWCVSNWGTKWPAHRVELGTLELGGGEDAAEVVFHFDTAWSPPLPLVRRASELFPTLTFELRYFESLGCFNGMLCCSQGEVSFDESGPYFGDRGG